MITKKEEEKKIKRRKQPTLKKPKQLPMYFLPQNITNYKDKILLWIFITSIKTNHYIDLVNLLADSLIFNKLSGL